MGLTIYQKIPSGSGQLVSIENLPITVTPNEEFHKAKAALELLVQQAGALSNLIQTDAEYNQAIESLQLVKRFIKDVESGAKPSKDAMNRAKDELMAYIKELQTPAESLVKALSTETARYFQEKERKRLIEEHRLREEVERERQRKQREADCDVLRQEFNLGAKAADDAAERNQPETAKEIRAFLKRFPIIDASRPNPLEDATAIRRAVANAVQSEQARIAAAKAREEGDKAMARRIEQAAKKQEAPIVEPVRSERVEAAPVVIPKADLTRAKGSYVKETWRVKGIYSPQSVPREFCEPSMSLLNAYAKRMGEKASVPGVDFEKETKMAGVRS